MIYDVIIIGAGPAGLTAALYAARYKLNVIVFENKPCSATYAYSIENYPGIKKTNGIELVSKMQEQVKALGVEIKLEEVKEIIKDKFFIVRTEKQKYEARTIILALGTEKRKLGLGEEKFIGKGVSYCAICDAPLFREKDVAVLGGGNSAIMAALLLAKYAREVFLIYRGKELKGDPIKVKELEENKKIKILLNTNIKQIDDCKKLESVTLTDGAKIKISGLFIEIGSLVPAYLIEKIKLKTDKYGYILVNSHMETNVAGVYAAGDCIDKPLRQIVTATNDGAIASHSIFNFLKKIDVTL
jgi:thioredoxin reductase (NADPH)